MIERIDIIGNGESRIGLDLDRLDTFKIGCNAAYRDFKVNCLVAVDRRMVEEAVDNSFQKPIYTRKDWATSFAMYGNVRLLPSLPYVGDLKQDDPWHWGTGPHACNLAATMKPREIHLWGFDLWSDTGTINNVYKGTKNYDPIAHHAIDPRFWVYQIAQCFRYYPEVKWIQHQPTSWRQPETWNFRNLSYASAECSISIKHSNHSST